MRWTVVATVVATAIAIDQGAAASFLAIDTGPAALLSSVDGRVLESRPSDGPDAADGWEPRSLAELTSAVRSSHAASRAVSFIAVDDSRVGGAAIAFTSTFRTYLDRTFPTRDAAAGSAYRGLFEPTDGIMTRILRAGDLGDLGDLAVGLVVSPVKVSGRGSSEASMALPRDGRSRADDESIGIAYLTWDAGHRGTRPSESLGDANRHWLDIQPVAIPVPAPAMLSGVGLIGVAAGRRLLARRRWAAGPSAAVSPPARRAPSSSTAANDFGRPA